jgi:hypothetical protein
MAKGNDRKPLIVSLSNPGAGLQLFCMPSQVHPELAEGLWVSGTDRSEDMAHVADYYLINVL